MHIKFLPHGKGLATAAVDYLVGERDAEGQRRDGVEVLRGNPDMVAAVADSLDFERKYTSVVIAWAPDDRPTDEQIEAVLDEFEKTAWAGLEPDRYAWTGSYTARAAAASTRTSSPRSATWRRAGASTSRPPDGRGPSTRCATPSTTSTAGAARTTRRAQGRSSRATWPTSRHRSCGPGSTMRPTRAT